MWFFYVVFLTVVVTFHSRHSFRRRSWTIRPSCRPARKFVSWLRCSDSSPCDVCRPDGYRSRKCEENRHKGSGARLHTHKHAHMHVICQHPLFLNFGVRQLPYMVKYEYVDSFDVLFKRFQEVLQTDITQINPYPANVENRASS